MTSIPCPKCGTPLNLSTDTGVFRCPKCGFGRPESLDEASDRLRSRGQRPAVILTYRGMIDDRARTLFDNGQDALWRGDKPAAIRAFQEAADIQPDFVDAHLWIAKTAATEKVRRDHLDEVLANDPGNAEALRLMMVLNGQMTPEEAARSRSDHAPVVQHVSAPVKASTTTLHCPVCGGDLTIDEANGRVICRFCGHTEPLDPHPHSHDGIGVVGAALLKQRGQSIKWIVGERILHCNQCGAERTIPTGRLSSICPFCGSNQVLHTDALKSFEQPNSLAPFVVSEDQAKVAIRERLNSVGQRIAGLLDNHEIAHASIEGIYLPFWVFDALIEVSKTTFDRRTPNSRDAVSNIQPYQNIKTSDGLNGVTITAVKSPPSALTAQLGRFDLSASVAYDPTLLAKYPAALYDVDFDQASLDAQGIAAEQMRQRYGHGDSYNVEVQVFTSVIQMTYTLMLLPVWVGTLFERDGDVRTALVNGQTGQVALGKAQKPA